MKKIAKTSFKHDIIYDITVEKNNNNNNTIVKKSQTVLYDGPDATTGIQLGINNLLPTQRMYIYNGSYLITKPLNVTAGVNLYGQGNDTILNYSNIGARNTIVTGKNSHLADLRIDGSINPLPNDSTQKIIANDNTIIENIFISNIGYGIETSGTYNVTLNNIRCQFILSRGDTAACVHGSSGTTNLSVDHFSITDSNRGIELGDNSTNILVQDGDLLRIKNFNHTGHEPFALDIHTHDRGGGADNITYQHIRMKDTYAPTAKVATINQRYAITDLPRDVLYQDIMIINPNSPWQVNSDGIKIKDSAISNNSKTNNIVIYTNSRNILIQNVSSNIVSDKHFFVVNSEKKGIKNVAIIDNTVIDSSNKSGPTMSFSGITDLTVRGNKIINAPRDTFPIDVKSVVHLDLNNNVINNSTISNNVTSTEPYFGTGRFVLKG